MSGFFSCAGQTAPRNKRAGKNHDNWKLLTFVLKIGYSYNIAPILIRKTCWENLERNNQFLLITSSNTERKKIDTEYIQACRNKVENNLSEKKYIDIFFPSPGEPEYTNFFSKDERLNGTLYAVNNVDDLAMANNNADVITTNSFRKRTLYTWSGFGRGSNIAKHIESEDRFHRYSNKRLFCCCGVK